MYIYRFSEVAPLWSVLGIPIQPTEPTASASWPPDEEAELLVWRAVLADEANLLDGRNTPQVAHTESDTKTQSLRKLPLVTFWTLFTAPPLFL